MTLVQKKIQKIGNSNGITFPPELLRQAGLATGTEVIVTSEPGRITIVALDADFDAQVAAADRFVARHPNAIRKLGQ